MIWRGVGWYGLICGLVTLFRSRGGVKIVVEWREGTWRDREPHTQPYSTPLSTPFGGKKQRDGSMLDFFIITMIDPTGDVKP